MPVVPRARHALHQSHRPYRRPDVRQGRLDPQCAGRHTEILYQQHAAVGCQPLRRAARRAAGSLAQPPLGEIPYLILDARYEKIRADGIVRGAAVLSAVGIGFDGRCSFLGVSVQLSEGEVHWCAILDSLVERRLHSLRLIVSDNHAGLKAAKQAVFGGVRWQRYPFHIMQNAIHHTPSAAVRERIDDELRIAWNALDLSAEHRAKNELVAKCLETVPKMADWLDENVDNGLAVFTIPPRHRRRPRTTNAVERAVNQEIKRRIVKMRVFPSVGPLLRLMTSIVVETDGKRASEPKTYIRMEERHDRLFGNRIPIQDGT